MGTPKYLNDWKQKSEIWTEGWIAENKLISVAVYYYTSPARSEFSTCKFLTFVILKIGT